MNQDISQIKVGIVGGGQLGKMMVLEGKRMGIYFIALDPNADCPASSIVDELIVGDFYDPLKIKELAEKCDVITYEFEHINAEVLIDLQKAGHKIYPSPHTLKKIQDKAYKYMDEEFIAQMKERREQRKIHRQEIQNGEREGKGYRKGSCNQ